MQKMIMFRTVDKTRLIRKSVEKIVLNQSEHQKQTLQCYVKTINAQQTYNTGIKTNFACVLLMYMA